MPRLSLIVFGKITNSIHIVFILQDKHLALLAQHDSQPFPPSLKRSAFGVLMRFCHCG